MRSSRRKTLVIVMMVVMAVSGWLFCNWLGETRRPAKRPARSPAPVEVAEIQRGPIVSRRTFSQDAGGPDRFRGCPEGWRAPAAAGCGHFGYGYAGTDHRGTGQRRVCSGRCLGRGRPCVARANLVEAGSALEISTREMERGHRHFVSAEWLRSHNSTRPGGSALQAGPLRGHQGTGGPRKRPPWRPRRFVWGTASVTADWRDGDDQRVVAERYVDEGDTVSENAPLLSIVAWTRSPA